VQVQVNAPPRARGLLFAFAFSCHGVITEEL